MLGRVEHHLDLLRVDDIQQDNDGHEVIGGDLVDGVVDDDWDGWGPDAEVSYADAWGKLEEVEAVDTA